MNNDIGSSVRMNSSALITILDKMFEVIKNMNEEIYSIYEIYDRSNKDWQGNAANIVFDIYNKYNKELQEGKIKGMYQKIMEAVNIIEANRNLTKELSEKEFEAINKLKEILEQGISTISSAQVNGINTPETGTITSDISANNNIGSVQTDFDAIPVNVELNNSVSIDTEISSNDVSLDDIYKPSTDSVDEVINQNSPTPQTTEESTPTNEKSNLGTAVGAGAIGDIISQKGGV